MFISSRLIYSIHGFKLVWSPTSEGPGAVIYFYEEPPFLFLVPGAVLQYIYIHRYSDSIQKNQTPVSVWFLLTYTQAVKLTFFFQQDFFFNSWFWFKFHTYQESNCIRKQNQVLDSSLVLISKIKPIFHSILTNQNQNQGFLSPERINTYQCWVVLTRTLHSQTSVTFGDKRPGYWESITLFKCFFENQVSFMGEPESNSQGRK